METAANVAVYQPRDAIESALVKHYLRAELARWPTDRFWAGLVDRSAEQDGSYTLVITKQLPFNPLTILTEPTVFGRIWLTAYQYTTTDGDTSARLGVAWELENGESNINLNPIVLEFD